MIKRTLITVLMISLVGCANSLRYHYSDEEEVELTQLVLGANPAPTSLVTLHLDDEIKQALDLRIDQNWGDKRKLRELRAFLFSDDERAIGYNASATRTASDTFHSGFGNCLALTNLFVAAGRYIGIDANYQSVSVRPTWDHERTTMIRYEHIVAVGNIGTESYVVDFLPEFLLGTQPSDIVSDMDALALYYNNLGAEAVVNGKPEEAILHLRKTLALNRENTASWNNMGAAMRRTGQSRLAEFAYFQALQIDSHNYSALSNLAQFYKTEGRSDEAQDIVARVERYRRRNPYFHYFVAGLAVQEGDIESAKIILGNAIRLKRDEPEFYEAAARIARLEGKALEADRLLKRADHYRNAKAIMPPERVKSSRLIVKKNM
jgi:Flp pilus assembly protein TadD